MENTSAERVAAAGSGTVAEELRHLGFARLGRSTAGYPDPARHAGDLAQLAEVCAHLPADPYAAGGANRFRRYSHAVHLPWTGELSFCPGAPDDRYGTVTEYWQDEHNPEYPDMRRGLPDIPPALLANELLLRLIRFDIGQTLWLEHLRRVPLYVGVHMIKLAVDQPGQEAVSSPDCLHQDGGSRETFTFAHLVGSGNVSGGENAIATPESAGRRPDGLPPGAVHDRFTLTAPLDGYAVHDHRVSHYVGPVRRGAGPGPGERSILIVGLAPYAPRL